MMAVQQRIDVMDNLLNLYRIDSQVRGLRSRLDTASRYLKTQQRLYDEIHQRIEELRTRKRQLQAKAGNFEGEIAVFDQRLEKFRGDLNTAANNKQYTAVLSELNTVKAQRGHVEDQMLQQMQQIETLDADLAKLQEQDAERTKVRDIAQAQFNERQNEVGARLAELEGERDAAAKLVPPGELAMFDSLADAYEGEALAKIEEIDRRNREYACGACNMHLPFEQVSLVLNSQSSMVRCTACGRILFMHEEVRGSFAAKK